MSLPTLVQKLRDAFCDELQQAAQIHSPPTYKFDDHDPSAGTSRVQKTRRRTVVSLQFCRFQSCEVIRQVTNTPKPTVQHSTQLARIAPRGGRYAYDVMAYVGLETFLNGRALTDVAHDLEEYEIPFSSLYDLQHKFLYYLGHLHRMSAPRIREFHQQHGGMTWLIDGTVEPGTPVFFGVKEAREGIFLGCTKMPTENEDDIARSLSQVQELFGTPKEVVHDLSEAIHGACEAALKGVSHYVCEFHLARDIGKDLYEAPQAALSGLLRKLKLQTRMKEQRRTQTAWLREKLTDPKTQLVLGDLLSGRPVRDPLTDLLAREVLLALHGWMLDFPSDGRRQGYPFDPYVLYFHRRVVCVAEALQRWRAQAPATYGNSMAVGNLSTMVNRYLENSQVVAAAAEYEAAHTLFQRLRDVLRLAAKGETPLYDPHRLTAGEKRHVYQSLQDFREECRQTSLQDSDPYLPSLCRTITTHLDRYWDHLPTGNTSCPERTTCGIEKHWGGGKRILRKSHSRKKLTQEFQALPEEFMLVPNLSNPRYVELVLGDLTQLASKLAEAGATASPFSHWAQRGSHLNLGRLSKRLLRGENFLERLLKVWAA